MKMLQPNHVSRVSNRHAQPNMWWGRAVFISVAKIPHHERTALGQNLKRMPASDLHGIEHGVDKMLRHLFVKEVAHRVHKNSPRLAPLKRLREAFGPQCEIKPVFEGVPRNAAKSLGKALRVAQGTTTGDLRTAGHRV